MIHIRIVGCNGSGRFQGIKEYKQRLISDVVTGQIKVCLFLIYVCLFIMLYVVISDVKLHFFDDISKENQHFFDITIC